MVHQFLLSGTTNFNTSHVTVYHHFLKIKKFASCYFNTSHVTVYRSSALIYRKKVRNFNTSHVTVYLGFFCFPRCPISDFNTSHVTVYHISLAMSEVTGGFQYIPCYGLSKNSTLQRGGRKDFNTSHVTVYPPVACKG